jgi:predicted AlkP superfamily phosphohydrolase/phosphomutase
MPAKLLVVGLDAAEASLLERWAREGYLPNVARLISEGVSAKLRNCMETLPGAIWPEIWSGRSGGKVGHFYHPEQIHTGEAVLRRVGYDEVDPTRNYWSVASRAGRRVCVVDQVQAVVDPDLNGIQILEWGLHDRTFAERSHPPELTMEIRRRYGQHPVRTCDGYGDSTAGREQLLHDLLDGATRKQRLLIDLMAREDWDLFACTLSESHCVGHHFWDCLYPHSNQEAYPESHRDAIRSVYQVLDQTIGALVAGAGAEAITIAIASHGIGPSRAGYQLLPEILSRLGMGSDRGQARGGALRAFQTTVKYNVPVSMLPALRMLAALRPVKALQRGAGALRFPLESPATRAAAVPNNRVGGIRLNLRGREPHGSVEPGHEAHALLDEIRTELLRLKDPATGKPIIERVLTAEETFGRDRHPDVPDLMVVFRGGKGPIETCESERVGRIHIPYFSRRQHRTGDHSPNSRLWAMGPGLDAGARLSGASTLDIAPTILRLLDVPVPEDLDGRPLTFPKGRESTQ